MFPQTTMNTQQYLYANRGLHSSAVVRPSSFSNPVCAHGKNMTTKIFHIERDTFLH
jgi:hypothetical protein